MELKTELALDPKSWMSNIGHSSRSEKIVTILGNLLENALEASASSGEQKKVCLSMTDVGNELIFEVEDSGSGISRIQKSIFDEGFTTKTGTGRRIEAAAGAEKPDSTRGTPDGWRKFPGRHVSQPTFRKPFPRRNEMMTRSDRR